MMCVMWGYCVFGVTLAGEGKTQSGLLIRTMNDFPAHFVQAGFC